MRTAPGVRDTPHLYTASPPTRGADGALHFAEERAEPPRQVGVEGLVSGVAQRLAVGRALGPDQAGPVVGQRQDGERAAGQEIFVGDPQVRPLQLHRGDHARLFVGPADLADAGGFRDRFTEQRDEGAWLRFLYDKWRAACGRMGFDAPDFDGFWQQGHVEMPPIEAHEAFTQFSDFAADPEANPLNTPSGKVELFSETIAGFNRADCPGLPSWLTPREWLGGAAADELHLLSQQPPTRLHSQLDPGPIAARDKIAATDVIMPIGQNEIVIAIPVSTAGASGAASMGLLGALAERDRYGQVVLIAGARSQRDFLYSAEIAEWQADSRIQTHITVDVPIQGWQGETGFVTEPLRKLNLQPGRTTAFLCGPESMMRFGARALLAKGMAESDIRVSLERNMQCGIGWCGHCQLGHLLLCRDGPVVGYDVARPLLEVEEL